MNRVKWGIIGTGNIARKFADDIKLVKNAGLTACASKDPDKAARFKEKYGIERSYGSYEEMLTDADIDAVYIATTHNLHHANALLCLEHGKHVLCEKPFVVNAAQAEEIFAKAEAKQLFVMEAMWTRFLPVTLWMKQQINDGKIGRPIRAEAEFGVNFPFDPKSRLFDIELAGGGLLDLGIYTVSFACNIFGNDPIDITGDAKIGRTGVDEEANILLTYQDGREARIFYTVIEARKNRAAVYGTEGSVAVDNIFAPTKAELVNSAGETTVYENTGNNGFEHEIAEATDAILRGEMQSPRIAWDDTVKMLKICDALRERWGLRYPGEPDHISAR